MRTRLLAALALSAVLVLAGACGDDDDDGDATADTPDLTETTVDDRPDSELKADLKGGAAEVPKPGDPDGTGKAEVKFKAVTNEVCYEIEVENIAEPTASHIHEGAEGASGGIVVTFDHTKIGKGESCVAVDHAVLDKIVENPGNFYVNVHNGEFPGGAVRGQLAKS